MKREDILKAANACVNGSRQQDYGNPEDNFKKIGDLWSAYTGHKYSPVDVSIMLMLMKVGRMSTGSGTDDTYIDMCGYAACAGEIATKVKIKIGDGSKIQKVDDEKSNIILLNDNNTSELERQTSLFDVNV